jgi:hypothetical protein
MKKLLTLIFGERAEGVFVPQPKLRTTTLTDRPSENDWLREFKVGSRYGHRGSYYENKPSVVKLNMI